MEKNRSIFDEMRRMQENMDALFNNFFRTGPFTGNNYLLEDSSARNKDLMSSNFMAPTSDVYETDKDFVAEIDLPGVDKKDIKVNVTDDGVEIKADKKHEVKQEDKKIGMFRLERSESGFYRKFALPENVDPDKAEAEYNNGVLKIKVPKLEIEKKKKKMLEVK